MADQHQGSQQHEHDHEHDHEHEHEQEEDEAYVGQEDVIEVHEDDDGDVPMDDDDDDDENDNGARTEQYDGEIVIGAPQGPEEEAEYEGMQEDNSLGMTCECGCLHPCMGHSRGGIMHCWP
jgi:hypothetical protein